MQSMTKDLIQGLLNELECPVCMEYMLPPIIFCENGHNVCKNCKLKLTRCPTCRKPFVNIRNMALENISRQVEYPCIFRKSGCVCTFPSSTILEHQQECSFGPYPCPFTKGGGTYCTWNGPLLDVKTHLLSNHSEEISETNGKFSINFNDVTAPGTYNFVVFAFGGIFFRHAAVREGNFYCALQFVGPKRNASSFKYKLTLQSRDSDETITMSRVARSCKEDIDDIFRSRKCVKLHLDVVKDYLNERNDLPNEIEITRR